MVPYTLNGLYDDLWSFSDRTPVDQLVFININTELRVDKGTSDPSEVSFIAMDFVGEGPRTTYQLVWTSCPR